APPCPVPTGANSATDSATPEHVMGGFGDQSNPSNPFRDWNVVFVSYCSCDVHFGDALQDYPPVVQHRGYDNSRIVEKWAREHFVNPDQIFVTGSSAGAYGAWFNAALPEMVWPASQFHVLADPGDGGGAPDLQQNEVPHRNIDAKLP